jgi:hypothetical protein
LVGLNHLTVPFCIALSPPARISQAWLPVLRSEYAHLHSVLKTVPRGKPASTFPQGRHDEKDAPRFTRAAPQTVFRKSV